MKQGLTTYLNHFWVCFLEPTSTGVIWGIYGHDPYGVWTHGPEVDTLSISPSIDCKGLDGWTGCSGLYELMDEIDGLDWMGE